MKKSLRFIASIFVAFSFLAFAMPVFAHQPVVVEKGVTEVSDPELSQAFYATLYGAPNYYIIDSAVPFSLYVNILVPKSSNPDGRFDFEVFNIKNGKEESIAKLNSDVAQWTEFPEEFANDVYLKGQEFKDQVGAGKYKVVVSNATNRGRYVVAIGEREAFGAKSIMDLFTTLPELKIRYFEVSPLTLVFGRLGIILVAGLLLAIALTFLIWKLIRFLIKKYPNKWFGGGAVNNINWFGRTVRLFEALLILSVAIYFWSYFLFFFSSPFFYAAVSGWSLLYSLLGKSSLEAQK